MESIFLSEGERKLIDNYSFTLNNPHENAINLFFNDSLMLVARIDIASMSMLDGSTATLTKNQRNTLEKRNTFNGFTVSINTNEWLTWLNNEAY